MAPPKHWCSDEFTYHPGACIQAPEAYTAGGRLKVWCKGCLELARIQYHLGHNSSRDTDNTLWDDAEFCDELKKENRGWIPYRVLACLCHLSRCERGQSARTRQRAERELAKHNAGRRQKYKLTRPPRPRPARPLTTRTSSASSPRTTSSSEPAGPMYTHADCPGGFHAGVFTASRGNEQVTIPSTAMYGRAEPRGVGEWQGSVTAQPFYSMTPPDSNSFAASPFSLIARQLPMPSLTTSTASLGSHVNDPGSDPFASVQPIGDVQRDMYGNMTLQESFQYAANSYTPPGHGIIQYDMLQMDEGYVNTDATLPDATFRSITHLPAGHSTQASIRPQPPPTRRHRPICGDSSSDIPLNPMPGHPWYQGPPTPHAILTSARQGVGQDSGIQGSHYSFSQFQYSGEPGPAGHQNSSAPGPLPH